MRSLIEVSKKLFLKPLLFFLMVFVANNVFAWGFWAHKRINYVAVFTLPPPLFYFYKKHIGYIEEHAVDPDKRRYIIESEAPRHYIDLDHYCSLPCDELPKSWYEAADSFSKDTLEKYGIVPWHINLMMYRLTEAFRNKDFEAILKLSADLGHYVADAHVPLHTTKNYNGQLSGQKGIHGFWESRLPELFAGYYDFFTGKAIYISDPLEFIWSFVLSSHAAVDSVLEFESELNAFFPADRKFTFENRGQTMVKTYSREYSDQYHKMLNNMVQKRMRRSIFNAGSVWYTCWINAGSPDLSGNIDTVITDTIIDHSGKSIKGREHEE